MIFFYFYFNYLFQKRISAASLKIITEMMKVHNLPNYVIPVTDISVTKNKGDAQGRKLKNQVLK